MLANQKNTQTPTGIIVSTKKLLHPLGENTKVTTMRKIINKGKTLIWDDYKIKFKGEIKQILF
jgi:hypothetical protein